MRIRHDLPEHQKKRRRSKKTKKDKKRQKKGICSDDSNPLPYDQILSALTACATGQRSFT